jgi:hypothetical protein
MGILVGMDEAGYGPNYGPLVVAATAWSVNDVGSPRLCRGSTRPRQTTLASAATPNVATVDATTLADVDLYKLLHPVVRRKPSRSHVAIADSKALYRPGGGLAHLERGVHAILSILNQPAESWLTLVDSLAADCAAACSELPWHHDFDCPVPIDVSANDIPPLAERLRSCCEEAEVAPVAIRARVVFPAEFNELCDHYGTKGAALSHVTLSLLRNIVSPLTSDLRSKIRRGEPLTPTLAVCDKHGGRDYYTPLLQHHFPDHWVEALWESEPTSRYRCGSPDSPLEVEFRVGGEAFLPTALASMVAKYLRELFMLPFNQFWCARVADLRPTAGYPADARRFRKAIAATQRELGIDDRILWRNR